MVIFSEGLAKVAQNYLQKGSKVYIEGQLQTRKWQDQSGQDKYTTEVVLSGFNGTLTMLDSRQDRGAGGGARGPIGGELDGPPQAGGDMPSFDRELDDEIPF